MLTNVFFSCGIENFIDTQIKELRRMCELPMIRKLGLGDKFPRKLLHAHKTSLGVGLIALNTVIYMLATRLWVGNKRLQD